MILVGVMLASVINSTRDPIAVLKEWNATIKRNAKGEVVGVGLHGAAISPPRGGEWQELLHRIGFGGKRISLSDAELVHLRGLANLQTLDLRRTNITDAGLVHLEELTTLQTLDLRRTKITDMGMVHLKGLTNLWKLDLPLQLTDAGVVYLKGLTKLQWLNLYRTPLGQKTQPTRFHSVLRGRVKDAT